MPRSKKDRANSAGIYTRRINRTRLSLRSHASLPDQNIEEPNEEVTVVPKKTDIKRFCSYSREAFNNNRSSALKLESLEAKSEIVIWYLKSQQNLFDQMEKHVVQFCCTNQSKPKEESNWIADLSESDNDEGEGGGIMTIYAEDNVINSREGDILSPATKAEDIVINSPVGDMVQNAIEDQELKHFCDDSKDKVCLSEEMSVPGQVTSS